MHTDDIDEDLRIIREKEADVIRSDEGAVSTEKNLLCKDLKVRECIGYFNASQKDKLGFASVRHQLYKSHNLSCNKDEVNNIVIWCMYNNLELKRLF